MLLVLNMKVFTCTSVEDSAVKRNSALRLVQPELDSSKINNKL
jgi:hypothetical protein